MNNEGHAELNWYLILGVIAASMIFIPMVLSVDATQTYMIRGENFDKEITVNTDDTVKVKHKIVPKRILDYYDGNDPVYVDFKAWEDADNIYFESAPRSYVFDKDTNTINIFDGGNLLGQPLKSKIHHIIKEAPNNSDDWNEILAGQSHTSTWIQNDHGIQIVSKKGDFETIYDVDYRNGFEWTYKYWNNDIFKNDHKYGFTTMCEGPECSSISVDDTVLEDGQTILKENLIDKPIKIQNSAIDLKEETHGYTWALKKQDSSVIIDFLDSKGALSYGETLIVDPTYTDTPDSEGRVIGNTVLSASCGTSYASTDALLVSYKPNNASTDNCMAMWFNFDVSSITSPVIVTSASIEYDITTQNANTTPCDWKHMDFTAAGNEATYDALTQDVGDVTDIKQGSTTCESVVADGYTVTFDTGNYATLFKNDIAGDGQVSIGMFYANQTRDGLTYDVRFRQSDAVLTIEYLQGPFDSEAEITQELSNIGDVFRVQATATLKNNNTNNENFTSYQIYNNGTLVLTNSTLIGVDDEESVLYDNWIRITVNGIRNITSVITFTNGTTNSLTNNTETDLAREYDPSYVAAIDNPSVQGFVNATTSRFDSNDGVQLKVNRIGVSTGDTWQIECIAQTNAEAAASKNATAVQQGTWYNVTGTGYLNATFTGFLNSHAYLTCYNEDLLFTITDFTDSSLALLGIQLFDESYGSMIGVPVGIFFLVMTAGMANKRTAPTFIILITGIAGTMATIGFFSFEPLVWGLALVTAMLGIFVNQKIF